MGWGRGQTSEVGTRVKVRVLSSPSYLDTLVKVRDLSRETRSLVLRGTAETAETDGPRTGRSRGSVSVRLPVTFCSRGRRTGRSGWSRFLV